VNRKKLGLLEEGLEKRFVIWSIVASYYSLSLKIAHWEQQAYKNE
jgi:hypothetical protein